MTDETPPSEFVHEVVHALRRSRALNAAMAFGVPVEATEDCRGFIAADLWPLVAARTRAAVEALHSGGDLPEQG
jgi:hypothetical protein